MYIKYSIFVLLLSLGPASNSGGQEAERELIQSRVIKTDAEELVLLQEVLIEAAVSEVWRAYVTDEGWMAWASPKAKIDLRAGGTIQTHYGTEAKIGDPGTNTLHIVNYVPERLLTLRAELSERWPDVMKEDEGKLMNVIVFEPIRENRTRLLSYGVGYRDVPAYDDLMKFFIPANEGLFRKLKEHLEPAKADVKQLSLESLAFMVGSWRANNGGANSEELWTPPGGGLMLGLNRQVSEGGTQWEFLRIESGDEGVVYWASPGGGEATPFKLIEASEGRAVFANPEHDFPQRLIYTREGDGLRARVEAGSGDEVRGFDLQWTLAASLD